MVAMTQYRTLPYHEEHFGHFRAPRLREILTQAWLIQSFLRHSKFGVQYLGAFRNMKQSKDSLDSLAAPCHH